MLFSWRIFKYTQLELDHVWVHFSGTGDLIGSLQEDDPVAIQGVKVGQVEEILSDTTGVRARLRFWKHQKIYRDAYAENVGNGLMGMRYVLLDPGTDSAHPIDPEASLEGTFHPGIAEVMSGIQQVVSKTVELRAWITRQAQGGDGSPPLHQQILSQLSATDSLLAEIDRIAKKSQALGPTLRSGAAVSKEFGDSLRSFEPTLVQTLVSTDTVLRQLGVLLVESGHYVRTADTLAKNAAIPLEPFTRNDSLLGKIETALSSVEDIQKFMDGKSPIKYNYHFFGAPSNPP